MVELDYKQILKKVLFPVYALPSDEVSYRDGLLTYNNQVIDDRNQEGKSIGVRRLASPHKLLKLRNSVLNLVGLMNCKYKYFIDSKGLCFQYIKTKMCTVESFEIRKKINRETYTLLILKRVNCPFVVSAYPLGKDWAQVLMFNDLPWKLLGVSEEKLKTSKRKV